MYIYIYRFKGMLGHSVCESTRGRKSTLYVNFAILEFFVSVLDLLIIEVYILFLNI